MGDDPASYRNTFEIKSKDEPASWAALIRLAKTLQDTRTLARQLLSLLPLEGPRRR